MSKPPSALTDFTASELGAGLRRGDFSCRELMQATLARIRALNPTFNAIVNLAADDDLLGQAEEADR
ncbi:MAG TPA: amidase, partial [Ramlibacter sp.]